MAGSSLVWQQILALDARYNVHRSTKNNQFSKSSLDYNIMFNNLIIYLIFILNWASPFQLSVHNHTFYIITLFEPINSAPRAPDL